MSPRSRGAAATTGSDAPAELLRRVPLFAGLTDDELTGLIEDARRVRVRAGRTVMRASEPGDGLYVLVTGEVEVTGSEDGDDIRLAVMGPGAVLGETSLLRERPRSASVRALQDSELLVIAPARFRALLTSSPAAALVMLRTVTERLRSTEASLLERERMAALGTLAAGITHELNNPAAAAVRGAALLPAALAESTLRTRDLIERLGPVWAARLLEAGDVPGGVSAGASRPAGHPFAAEEAVAGWLEARGLPRGEELAPPLAQGGWGPAALDALAAELEAPEALPAVVAWLAAMAEVRSLAAEIHSGATAIAGIVAAVKDYVHLDRAPLQRVNLGAGIDNTLLILRGKIGAGIRVERQIPADLPLIEGYPRELSQVWTNLIDNAVDAMAGTGVLEIVAQPVEGGVVVRVMDSGSGIPRELRNRIFDPFFTTKPPGAGSGLGLAIARSIVVNRHRGRIRVRSRPGRTVFEVQLPLCLPGPGV